MTLHVKDSNTWKQVTNLYVKDAGSWKEVTSGQVKDASSWKEFHTTGGGGGGGPAYVISATGTSGSGTTIDASFSVTPTGDSTNPQWTMNFVSSSPPGFWAANTGSTSAWAPTLRSVSNTASAGTLVQITYRVNFSSNAGSADETNVTFSHQF